MKKLIILSAIFLLTWAPLSAQGKPSEPNRGGKAEPQSTQKSEYQKKVEAKLCELNEQIGDLKKKASEQSKTGQKELDEELKELDRKRVAAEQEFEKLKHSSLKAWRDMKPGIDAAMKDLETAYKRAASDFK